MQNNEQERKRREGECCRDCRSQWQIDSQGNIVRNISKRNLQIFGIVLSDKSKVQYQSLPLERVDLGKGWYCYLTDNKVISQQTVLTLHGAPGNHTEWAGLQSQIKNDCRWINLVIPGFDGQDQRRGDYNSSLEQFGELLIKLLNEKKIKQVVLCAHSFSTSLLPYLLQTYPKVFHDFINIAGMTDQWSLGFMVMYHSIVAEEKYYQLAKLQIKPWDSIDGRRQIYQSFKVRFATRTLGTMAGPALTETQFYSFLKLSLRSPQEMNDAYHKMKNNQALKVLIYASKDIFHFDTVVQATLFRVMQQQNSVEYRQQNKIMKLAKANIEKGLREQFGIEIEGDKIQSYLIFLFEKTGHAVHRRRPIELSRIIKIYLVCLKAIVPFRHLSSTNL